MAKFAVMQVGWEYDDCKYVSPNENAYDHNMESVGVYDTREEAERVAFECTVNDLPGMVVTDHGYGPSDIFDDYRYQELVEILGIDKSEEETPSHALINWWHDVGEIPQDISHEDAVQVARCLGIELYVVEEYEPHEDHNGW